MPHAFDTTRPRFRIPFAAGAAGWAALERVVVMWAMYAYAPPEGSGLPTLLPAGLAFGVLPWWALVVGLGRLSDAVLDPVVARASDRSRSRYGRRWPWMAAATLPAAGFAALLFWPGATAALSNVWFAAGVMAVFYAAFTAYVGPHMAWMAELGTTERTRLQLSTDQAVAVLVGAAGVTVLSPMLVGALEPGFGPSRVAVAMGIIAALAGALMLWPVLALRGHAVSAARSTARGQAAATLDQGEARVTAAPRGPRLLRQGGLWRRLLGLAALHFGFNTMSMGVPYIATVLLGKTEAAAGGLTALTFGAAGLAFWPVGKLAKRFGALSVLQVSAAWFALCLGGLAASQNPIVVHACFFGAGLSVSALLALGPAVLSAFATSWRTDTGQAEEGMVFGLNGVVLKTTLGLSAAVFSGALALGPRMDAAAPDAAALHALLPFTALCTLAAAAFFWRDARAERRALRQALQQAQGHKGRTSAQHGAPTRTDRGSRHHAVNV